ncbi:MAG: pyridoxal phosphate-dependent class II aminotransferase [Paludibacteraceae bacterium]|nr:pyridoxal phosphate-dependent class II aminotransferase [Paludibacteraceae bacterium]
MIKGHGDDIYQYSGITSNFSSNVCNNFCHMGLYRHLSAQLPAITNYPEAAAESLEKELERQLCLEKGEVMVTNGATEAIYLVAQVYSGSVSAVIAPTFSEYADACHIHHHTVKWLHGIEDLAEAPKLLWLCNPNNPTGQVVPLKSLLSAIASHPDTLFVIDCSYAPFTEQPTPSAKQAVAYPNMLLLHSFTKRFSIPGLRLGYITGNSGVLEKIRPFRMPWSVNQIAISAGHYLLEHQCDYPIDTASVKTEVDYLTQQLTAMGGFVVSPTDCQFMLVHCQNGTAASLKEFLVRKCGILIRNADNFKGLDHSYFRIAVQKHDENEALIKGIEQWKNTL